MFSFLKKKKKTHLFETDIWIKAQIELEESRRKMAQVFLDKAKLSNKLRDKRRDIESVRQELNKFVFENIVYFSQNEFAKFMMDETGSYIPIPKEDALFERLYKPHYDNIQRKFRFINKEIEELSTEIKNIKLLSD